MRYIKEHRKKNRPHPTGNGCQHHPNCENCPHPDCIATDNEIVRYDAANKTNKEESA